jgi:hypothetical protein
LWAAALSAATAIWRDVEPLAIKAVAVEQRVCGLFNQWAGILGRNGEIGIVDRKRRSNPVRFLRGRQASK